jgi:hypothetical protein
LQQSDGPIAQQLSCTSVPQPLPCVPKDWLDVLQPLSSLLGQLQLRFRALAAATATPGQAAAAGCSQEARQQLLSVLVKVAGQHLPEGGQVAKGPRAPDRRRLLGDLQMLARYCNINCAT